MTDAILAFERKEEDDFYALLGCDELSNTEQILVEYKIRALALHPDKNSENAEACQQFVRLQRAKEVLTDPTQRTKYDQWRRCGIAVSFDDWLSKKDLVRMSMHWVGQKPKQHMLEEKASEPFSATGQKDPVPKNEPPKHDSDRSSISARFRSYQI